ncbi:MAG: spermidine synthase [Burkholderiaceae bacterium]
MRKANRGDAQLRITVSEEKGVRYLHFGTEWVQGAMRVRQPWNLELDYSRHMMAWLLFNDAPERVLQIGLGAGSLTKFVHRSLPDTELTVVENSPSVVAVARGQFRLPADDERLEIVIDDGQAFVSQPRLKRYFSILQIDVFDQNARGPVLDSLEFYEASRRVLAPGGIMAVNLFGDVPSYRRNYERILAAFDGRVLVLPPLEAGNVIVLGFQAPLVESQSDILATWGELRARAGPVEERFGLNAHGWINGLKVSAAKSLGDGLIGDG